VTERLPEPSPGGADIRISDADRERVVDLLRHHCAEGRLTLDEFSDRVGAVYEAKTSTALEQALVDLPGSALPGLRPPLPATASGAGATKPVTRRRAAVKRVWG